MIPPLPDPTSGHPFWKSLDAVEKFEGGRAHDPDDPGGDTKWGITQGEYDHWRDTNKLPRQSVFQMMDEECTQIYWDDFWCGIGQCDKYVWPFCFVQFDAVVNMSPYWWRQCLAASIGSSAYYLDKREWCYRQIVVKRPASRKFLSGWLDRVQKVRSIVAKG